MATGGEVGGTREQRSDGAEDYRCSVCSKNGQTTEASHYCPDCDTCYCKACLCDHAVLGRSKVEKWGNSTRSAVKKEDQSVEEEVKCLRHPQYKVELYCVDHDVLCCQMCRFTDHSHRSCKKLEKIADAAGHVDLRNKLQSVQDDISTLQKNAELLSKDSVLKKRFIESSHIRYLSQLRAMQENVNAQFEKVRDESESQKQYYIDKFNTDHLVCEDIRSKLPELTIALEPLEDKTKYFVNVKRTKEWVDGKNNAVKIVRDTPVTGIFRTLPITEEKNAIKAVVNAISINMVDMKFTVEMKNDKQESNIVGICQIENGYLVLADKANKCLKQLDGNYTVIYRYVLKDNPEGICAMDGSEVAVTTENKHIFIVAVGNTFEIRYSIELSYAPWHVSTHDQFLYVTEKKARRGFGWCSCAMDIIKYDTFGNKIETLQLGNGGNFHNTHGYRPLASSPDEDKMYVGGDSCLYCVTLKGTKTVESSEYGGIGGICVDKSRCLYISKTNRVLKLSQTRKESFKTLCATELEETPGALCYDNRLDRVVVCSQTGNYIYIRQI